jgi:hypothetical protein
MPRYGAWSARSGEAISLGVNADGDDNGKDNRCFDDVNPHCALGEPKNDFCFRHDFDPNLPDELIG